MIRRTARLRDRVVPALKCPAAVSRARYAAAP